MSIDQLGRVIVGSGHFVERAPDMIEMTTKIVVGAGHIGPGIGRIAQNITHLAREADLALGKIFKVITKGKDPAEEAARNVPSFWDTEKNIDIPNPDPQGLLEPADRWEGLPSWFGVPDKD
jgi:hypothetical protein